MAKYSKYIFLIAAIILITASLTVFKRTKNKISFNLKENEVLIDNFEMGKVLDQQNNFYKISARHARVEKENETATLQDFAAHYKKGNTRVDLYAPEGTLQKEYMVTVKGKVHGRVDDVFFTTSRNGFLYYDFLTGIGTVLGSARFNYMHGAVRADKVVLYTKNKYVEFIGHVKVVYNK